MDVVARATARLMRRCFAVTGNITLMDFRPWDGLPIGKAPERPSICLATAGTEIDDVAPIYSRTYRNVVSAVDVLRADRMPLFVKKFNSDSCFQQGCRRISGESL